MTRIELRRGTASEWAAVDPILAVGEPGFETDTGRFKVGDGTAPWTQLPAFLNDVGPNAAYVKHVGPATGDPVADTAKVQAALDAVNNVGGGTVILADGAYVINATLTVGSYVTLAGQGMSSSVLKLANETSTHILANADPANGNDYINLRDFSIDGNKAGQTWAVDVNKPKYGVHFRRVRHLTISNIWAHNVHGTGVFLTGDAIQTRPTHLSNVRGEENDLDGVWVGNAMREVYYGGVFGRYNARHGVVIDHSEAITSGVDGYGNTGYGIWVRNVHGCTLNGLSATFNGDHGIYVIGLTLSIGAAWKALNNGQEAAGRADVYFDQGQTTPGYGPTDGSQVVGITAGYDPHWPGGKKTDYCVYVADGLAGYDVKLSNVNNAYGSLVSDVRVPAGATKLYVAGNPTGNNTAKVWAGNPATTTSATKIRTVSAAYTLTDSEDDIVLAQGAFTVTLPGPGTVAPGRRFTVKNGNTTTGDITLATAGAGKTIDGTATQTLSPLAKATVVSDGSNWWIV